MKIIGITAPIGCGKSYVAAVFKKHGIPTIDSDKVYHGLVSKPSETVTRLAQEFGNQILTSDGALDRKKLAPIVFSDPNKLKKLNMITHSAVSVAIDELLCEIEKTNAPAVTVQVPLMFESGFDKRCDTVICVSADEATRIARICVRDACTSTQAKNRIKNQKDLDFYIANSDKTVYNNGYEDVDAQVLQIIESLELNK